jgi:hypothetical protein
MRWQGFRCQLAALDRPFIDRPGSERWAVLDEEVPVDSVPVMFEDGESTSLDFHSDFSREVEDHFEFGRGFRNITGNSTNSAELMVLVKELIHEPGRMDRLEADDG